MAGMSDAQRMRIESMKRTWEQRKQVAQHLSQIRRRIAVYSGKGGVGKTTVAVNMAMVLAEHGRTVGLLDADIDCPNVVKMMKIENKPLTEEGRLIPVEKYGVRVISMGFFQQNEEEAIIWRGPMVHNAINQFLELTNWGELDYLVTDLPPGTSDAPLTVMQVLKVDGFVVVTTPQELALLDAKRSINMIHKMQVPVLGVVENMAGEVFGSGTGEQMAKDMGLNFLGRVQMSRGFRDAIIPASLVDGKVREEFEVIVKNMELALAPAGV